MKRWMTCFAMVLGACSADGGRTFFNDGGVDTGNGPTGDGGLADRPRDAIPIRDTGPTVIGEDAACATTVSDGHRLPMNLLVVLDRSGSMQDNGKWAAAVSAIRGLLPRLDDETRVGITFFPSASGPDTAAGYTTPAVPVGPLSTTRATILSRLSATTPNGNTPMTCAIQGTTSYFRGYTADGSRNVILITDGIPTEECTDTNMVCGAIPNLFDLAAFARWAQCRDTAGQNAMRVAVTVAGRETPPLRVFVAGTPEASDTFLSDLAVSGGSQRSADCRSTMSCHYSLRLGSFEADLAAAFDEIRGRALSCEFDVNVDPTRVDPTRVNVNFQGTGDATGRLVPRDVDHRDGWDYSAGMRSVVLYGPTCDRVRNDAMARVRILFGCPTVTPG